MIKKLFAFLLVTVTIFTCIPFVAASALEDNIITLDPGHGRNSGATGAQDWGGLQEDHYNLTISLQTEKVLKETYGVKVFMTRTTHEENPGYSDRVNKALNNNSGTFVSIHNNSYDISSLRGSCIFIPNDNLNKAMYDRSYDLGVKIQNRLRDDVGVPIKDRPYAENSGTRPGTDLPREKYAIMWRAKEWGLTRACIVECCFQSNYEDVHAFLLNPAKLIEMGTAIADGIADHLGLQADNGEKINCIEPGSAVTNGSAAVNGGDVTRGETFSFQGWSVHEDGIANYEYSINGGSWKSVDSAYSRSDVVANLDTSIFGACTDKNSFKHTLDTSALSVGSNTISLRGVTKAGDTYDIGKISLFAMPAAGETFTTMEKNLFSVGEEINVTAKGMLEGAWVAVFMQGEVPGNVKSICYFEMHDSTQTFDLIGDGVFNSSRGGSPLQEGTYVLYTFVDESYKVNTSVEPITFIVNNAMAAEKSITPKDGTNITTGFDMVFGVKDMLSAEEVANLFEGNCVVKSPQGTDAPAMIGSGCKIYLCEGDIIYDIATIIVEGDLDGNGISNGKDLIRAKKMMLGTMDYGWIEAGDFDGDCAISDSDISILVDVIANH